MSADSSVELTKLREEYAQLEDLEKELTPEKAEADAQITVLCRV